MAWTEERVALLTKLWTEGLSASQIAARLGEVTRNAVIGKVHRLGLSGRTTTSRPKSVRPRKSVARVRKPRNPRFAGTSAALRELAAQSGLELYPQSNFQPDEELVIPVDERKTVLTLREHNCRWPIGDPQNEEFHFCGRNKVAGLPYCDFHARKAFQPIQVRRRDANAGRFTAIAG